MAWNSDFTWTVFLDLFIAITACNLIPICSSISWLIAHLKETKRVTWGVRRGRVRDSTVSRRLFDYFSLHIDGYICLSAFENTIKLTINVSLPPSCYWIALCYFSYLLFINSAMPLLNFNSNWRRCMLNFMTLWFCPTLISDKYQFRIPA